MGCFSFLKADNLTKIANIVEGKSYKFLIPKEFGGGFIRDFYRGYGRIGDKKGIYDMYEILAFWNSYMFKDEDEKLLYNEKTNLNLKPIDEYTIHNRSLGCDIGSIDRDMRSLKFPLKLVSLSYKGTYEECENCSTLDPNQGIRILKR